MKLPSKMVRYPNEIVFRVQGIKLARQAHVIFMEDDERCWQLSGALRDGREIECKNMLMRHFTYGPEEVYGIFRALSPISIGCKFEKLPNKIHYRLVGYYNGPFNVEHHGWIYTVSNGDIEEDTAKRVYSGWEIIPEGASFTLSCAGATLDEYELEAHKVMQLMALASGTGVTYHRYAVEWDTGEKWEEWRQVPAMNMALARVSRCLTYGASCHNTYRCGYLGPKRNVISADSS
jgi:hypothetical protein